MSKRITARMKLLIEKARIVSYSKEEISLLIPILEEYAKNDFIKYNYTDISFEIRSCIKTGSYAIDRDSYWVFGEEDNEYKNLNLFQYLLVYHRKVFMFLTCVGREHIPLYLNRDPLIPFAEWRLKIVE
jgi:hypothetical protein